MSLSCLSYTPADEHVPFPLVLHALSLATGTTGSAVVGPTSNGTAVILSLSHGLIHRCFTGPPPTSTVPPTTSAPTSAPVSYTPSLTLAPVTAVCGSADGTVAFVGSSRGHISRVSINADATWGSVLATTTVALPKTAFVADKLQGILALAPHPDGTVLAVAYSNVIAVLDAQSLAVVGWCDDRHSEGVVDLSWVGPSVLAAASLDGLASVANAPTCADFDSSSLDMVVLSDGQPLDWLRMLPDGTAITGASVGTIIHWGISTWSATPLARRNVDLAAGESLLPAGVRGFTVDALCGVGPMPVDENSVWFRTNSQGALGVNGDVLIDTPHTDVVRSVTSLTADGRQVLLSCAEDGTCAVWSAVGGGGRSRALPSDKLESKRRR